MSKWPLAKLGDVISFRGGGTPRKDNPGYWGDEIPWATVKDFNNGLVLSKTKDAISSQGLKSSASNLISAGHVIIPTRMALGKAAINTIDVAINQDLRALIPNEPLEVKYLLHAMLGLADKINRQGSGATVKGITQAKLKNLEIPFPPLAEQKRIAKILDAADALRAKRRESIAQLDSLLQSTFLELFGDPVENPKGWGTIRFQSVIGNSLRNGLSPSTKGAVEGRVLTLSAISSGSFDDSYSKEVVFDRKPARNQRIDSETFLMCRGNGNKKLVGIGVFAADSVSATSFPDTMIAATPDRRKVDRAYLQAIWNSRVVRRQIERGARTTNGTFKVNQQLLKNVEFPLPSMDLQARFAGVVESAARQRVRMRAHLAELDQLFASLQQRAFNGEL